MPACSRLSPCGSSSVFPCCTDLKPTATGIDYGKDLAEKQLLEKLAPRIAERFAAKIGAETAEKWAGRLIPLASSVIGGALNFSFVRGWGRRVQRHLRAKHLEAKASTPPPSSGYGAVAATVN